MICFDPSLGHLQEFKKTTECCVLKCFDSMQKGLFQ